MKYVAIALRHERVAQRRADIDNAFSATADENEYHAKFLKIAHESGKLL